MVQSSVRWSLFVLGFLLSPASGLLVPLSSIRHQSSLKTKQQPVNYSSCLGTIGARSTGGVSTAGAGGTATVSDLTHHRNSFVVSPMATNDSEESSNDDEQNPSASTTVPRIVSMIGSSTSTVVASIFFIVLSYERNAFMLTFFIGSILNGILTKVMKKLINQERPATELESGEDAPGDKGMPSSHAASLGFIGTVTALNLPNTVLFLPREVVIPLMVAYSAISLLYRVGTKLHTPPQIYVGLVLGVSNAVLWNGFMFGSLLGDQFRLLDIVSDWFHLEQSGGVFPMPYLILPAVVGFVVVGSLERKISKFLRKNGIKERLE